MRTLVIVYIIVASFALVGWVKNIVKFVNLDFKESYKTEIIRGIGIVAPPIGAVIGYLKIGEENAIQNN